MPAPEPLPAARPGPALIPPEVPELPAALQTRPELLSALKEQVLRAAGEVTESARPLISRKKNSYYSMTL